MTTRRTYQAKAIVSRINYYLRSLPTLFSGIENWPALFSLLLRQGPATLRLRGGLSLTVSSLMDAWIVKETCLDRVYETHSAPIENGWIVVDIGAGIGDFATQTARDHPQTQVFAFEPFPPSYALLLENIALNCTENVRPFPLAVCGRGTGSMTLSATGAAVQHTTTPSAPAFNVAPTLEVACISLDTLFESNQLERCDYLKMDCEGGEYDILLNTSPDTLHRIRRMCLEYHDGYSAYSHRDLEAHLISVGFQTACYANPAHGYLGLLHAWQTP
ncbi:MAG: FkbM family methyltransferase [Anaerolineae bacterium]|nr:FkbM family methyltransferase [Thermoflexales bacterium]MDW8409009.1 FkbM family methyltransferase [Anaerolineae bacterium]